MKTLKYCRPRNWRIKADRDESGRNVGLCYPIIAAIGDHPPGCGAGRSGPDRYARDKKRRPACRSSPLSPDLILATPGRGISAGEIADAASIRRRIAWSRK